MRSARFCSNLRNSLTSTIRRGAPVSAAADHTPLSLKTKHEIDVRNADDVAPGDIYEREIGRELLSHEAEAEGVEEVVVGNRKQVVLGHDSDPAGHSQFAANHSHRFCLDFSPGKTISATKRDARVAVAERSHAVIDAASSALRPGE